jgi:hypothetical protein
MKRQMEKVKTKVSNTRILKNSAGRKLGYIFSKYDSLAHVKRVKIRNLFGNSMRPYGV